MDHKQVIKTETPETEEFNGITEGTWEGRRFTVLEPQALHVLDRAFPKKPQVFVGMLAPPGVQEAFTFLLDGYGLGRYELFQYTYSQSRVHKIVGLQSIHDKVPRSPQEVIDTDCGGEAIIVINHGRNLCLANGRKIKI